jgi:DNA-binding PadR family transcriptional regulator
MRRKPGALLPIELSILRAGIDLAHEGSPLFHGYGVAKEIREREEARRLTAHGTLYRALDRLEGLGLLKSVLEEPDIAAAEHRPRRHLYRVTALGEQAYSTGRSPEQASRNALQRGMAPT